MLKLLNAEDLLEHLVQLVLAQDELRGGAGCQPLLELPGVFFTSVDGVKFGDPRAQHRLLAEAVNLGQTAHSLLYVLLEHLPGVAGRAAAALHHPAHAVALQEDLHGPQRFQFKEELQIYWFVFVRAN